MHPYSTSRYLHAVRLNRVDFEKLIDLVVDEFAPEQPVLRIQDRGSARKRASAKTFSEFVDHPDIKNDLHMVEISARDATTRDACKKRISVLLYNTGPELIVEADDDEWAESAARTLDIFLCRHRPWHFSLPIMVRASLAGLAIGGVFWFGFRLIYRIVTWNFTPDFVLTSLAGVAGSVACALTTVLLPLVEIQLGDERNPFIARVEYIIRISAALAVLLLMGTHWV